MATTCWKLGSRGQPLKIYEGSPSGQHRRGTAARGIRRRRRLSVGPLRFSFYFLCLTFYTHFPVESYLF